MPFCYPTNSAKVLKLTIHMTPSSPGSNKLPRTPSGWCCLLIYVCRWRM